MKLDIARIMKSNKINIAHIRNKNKNLGGYTIAYTDLPRDTSGNVQFTIARCNDKDNFCRKTGRAISVGRLMANKSVHSFHSNVSRRKDVLNQILERIEVSRDIGIWCC
jgi:hypothetical protein